MRLHEYAEDFQSLIALTAKHIGIPEDAVKRDYYIVSMLQKLQLSAYADCCVFKGGTSLSKCYPGSIERFSEDIDLTFVPSEPLSKKQYGKAMKKIEEVMTEGYIMEIIPEERNDRNKSAYVFFDDSHDTKVKLEIGSSIRPDPFMRRGLKTYIQEYLESQNMMSLVADYKLVEVMVNTLAIERTFLDKVMSVKRHAICGTLDKKVRHIYDVTRLLERDEIQTFISNSEGLKLLLQETKNTDSFYLGKRNISVEYNPVGKYDFESWRSRLDDSVCRRYESLHKDLLYTNQKQDFDDALDAFEKINSIFESIGE